MKREELERIDDELFSALTLDDQQGIMGQNTNTASHTDTFSFPKLFDGDYDMDADWS